jgi:hypothetical protein
MRRWDYELPVLPEKNLWVYGVAGAAQVSNAPEPLPEEPEQYRAE